jgi:hypothetical protein
VFEDDEQIKQFLEMVDEFSETHIDQENQNDHAWIMREGENPEKFQDNIANHRMLFLKKNQILRGPIVVSPRPSPVVNHVLKGIVIMIRRLVNQVCISWRLMCC